MNYVYLAVIGCFMGIATITLLAVYLYRHHRERYVGWWLGGWLFFLLRYAVFDSAWIVWQHSPVMLIMYQALCAATGWLFLVSTYEFLDKPMRWWWKYCMGGSLLAGIGLSVQSIALTYQLLPVIYTCCAAYVVIGIAFLRCRRAGYLGELIGCAYILLGLLNFVAPFTIINSWFTSWGYIVGSILRFVIAITTMALYFKRSQKRTAERDDAYRRIADNASDIIYHYRLLPQEKLEYVSPSVWSVTGYTPDEYYADPALIARLVEREDYAAVQTFINSFPQSIEQPLSIQVHTKDKGVLWVEQKCVPIYERGRLVAVQGIIRDITHRKMVEQMALERMKLAGSMAATVAHEIRNPMTTVRGYLQFLGRKPKYQTDHEKFTLMIEELDRANDIICEYLALSRHKAAHVEQCSLNDIIDVLFPLIQANASAAKVCAICELEDIPQLFLDKNEIRQLLLNLVQNAIEAMPDGGDLIIRTFVENGKIVLAICDQGAGIPSAVLEKMATPFFTTKETGTGLGLSTCYQIAHRHNADIKIDTSDKGTIFFICFARDGHHSILR